MASFATGKSDSAARPITGHFGYHSGKWKVCLAKGKGIGMDAKTDPIDAKVISKYAEVVVPKPIATSNRPLEQSHFRSRPDVVLIWSDEEVVPRWMMLCPDHRQADGTPVEPTEPEINFTAKCPVKLAELWKRLSNVSWWMRLLCRHDTSAQRRIESLQVEQQVAD